MENTNQVQTAYSPAAVANAFLDIAEKQGKQLDHMKIQKLVYLAHAWNLTLNSRPLINGYVEAWKFGPVIPELYQQCKHFGSNNITEKIIEYATSSGLSARVPEIPKVDRETWALLDRVWEVYGQFTALQLSSITHQGGTPWYETWEENKDDYGFAPIPARRIVEHYNQLRKNKRAF